LLKILPAIVEILEVLRPIAQPHHPFTMALHLFSFENSALAEEVERRCRVEIKEGYSADG